MVISASRSVCVTSLKAVCCLGLLPFFCLLLLIPPLALILTVNIAIVIVVLGFGLMFCRLSADKVTHCSCRDARRLRLL